MEIFLEDLNHITIESVKGRTMGDLLEDVKGAAAPVTFAVAEKIEGNTVTVGSYEPQFTLSSDNDEEDGELKIDCSLCVLDVRKYYEGVIDIGILHKAIRNVAIEKQLDVVADDDEPAFYNTFVYFKINTSLEEPAERFLNNFKQKAADIYLEGKRKAIDEQIQSLQEYRKAI